MENSTASTLPLSRHAFQRVVFGTIIRPKVSTLLLTLSLITLSLSFTACKGAGTGDGSSSGGSGPGTIGGPAGGGGGGGGGGGAGGGGAGGGTLQPTPPIPDDPDNNVPNISTTLTIDQPSLTQTIRAATSFQGVTDASQASQLLLTTRNVTSFQIVTQSGGARLTTLTLTNPANSVVLSIQDPLFQTSAVIPVTNNDINALPYPANSLNPPMTDGLYKQLLSIVGAPGQQYFGVAVGKNDPTPASGLLRVNIFLVGTSAQRAEVRDGVNRGVDIWRSIYAQIGITLDVATFDITSGTGVLPNPFLGSLFYESTISNTPGVRAPALNMFIASLISSTADTSPGNAFEDVLGVASAIPGPATTTMKSAVAISVTEHEGNDSSFDPDDISVFAETMAHEAGHYLGLFHPVEDPEGDNTFVAGDPLPDTPVCQTSTDCIAVGLASNLMFPSVVFGIPQQRDLTLQQGRVVNLQTIVD